ncbi:MAG: BREX system ATP-binding protein BrxD [Myxococcales bacterium]|nr:BREX system ATP-binding protein BrxD [Myxococcales bacterium]
MTLPLARRREVIAALRNGTVPRKGLEALATGLDRFERAVDEELARCASGGAVFKAVRGEYGAGKTFWARWIQHRAQLAGFATAEVQINETETPLHRMETIYRRAMENLRTRDWDDGAFRTLVGRWFFALEEEVLARPGMDNADASALSTAVSALLEQRLSEVSRTQPSFAAALRRCHQARSRAEHGLEEGLLSWLMGQPHVSADIKRAAGLKGEVDHFMASAFFRGLLAMLQQSGRKGLLLVLDEAETIQRMRGDVREKSLNALRQWIDDIDGGRYPGLYLVVTGTPAFFDGPQGVKRLAPLAQRVHVDFDDDPRWDNTRAVQVRLLPFDHARLCEVGRKVRDLYPATEPDRVRARVSDDLVAALARDVSAGLGGRVGIAPRIFLKKLVASVLDRVDEHADFDPAQHFKLTLDAKELTADERHAAGIERSVDEVELDLSSDDKG